MRYVYIVIIFITNSFLMHGMSQWSTKFKNIQSVPTSTILKRFFSNSITKPYTTAPYRNLVRPAHEYHQSLVQDTMRGLQRNIGTLQKEQKIYADNYALMKENLMNKEERSQEDLDNLQDASHKEAKARFESSGLTKKLDHKKRKLRAMHTAGSSWNIDREVDFLKNDLAYIKNALKNLQTPQDASTRLEKMQYEDLLKEVQRDYDKALEDKFLQPY